MTSQREKRSLKKISKFTVQERIDLAERKLDRLDNLIAGMIYTNANINEAVLSSALTEQIPRSYAAHAVNTFQSDLVHFELIRLASVWDPVDPEKDSIPTVLALLNSRRVRSRIFKRELRKEYTRQPSRLGEYSPDTQAILDQTVRDENRQRMRGYRHEFSVRTARACRLASAITSSKRLSEIRRYRDYTIAHNIDSELKKTSVALDGRLPKYGQAGKLLRATCVLLFELGLAVSRINYPFDDRFVHAEKCARELWRNTKVEGIK